ncbi:hypothetical protein [Pelomonas sp. Root1237]|uniref:hypothetical protein n=1 Tax=Pelomonas sp. Root1237 TaxID=1736434 RepID=UPI0012F800D5|nr:hypothetical protein [Pelomonas sp. Root1237]
MIRFRDLLLFHVTAICIAGVFVTLGFLMAGADGNEPIGNFWLVAKTGLKFSYQLLSLTLSLLVQILLFGRLIGLTIFKSRAIDPFALAIFATQAIILWALLK